MHVSVPAVKVEKGKNVIKIARTIADLESSTKIKSNHVAEALQYRPSIQASSGKLKVI